MRVNQIVGAVLILAGIFVLWKRPTYPTHHDVVQIGDFKASMDQEEGVPLWLGAAAIGLGVALLVLGRKPAG